MPPGAASPSCPRCGAESRPGESRCGACGFAFLEGARRRPLPRPSGRVLALAAAALAAAGVVAAAGVSGGDTAPRLPSPVPAVEAERRLEARYGSAAAVRCPRRIDPERIVRCELRLADGVPRALLVRLSPIGELEADIPYPATLR